MPDRAPLVLIAAGALVFCGPLAAQTTGRIVGQVADDTGLPLLGVTVTVRSPSLQGPRSTTTDARGEFRCAFLPPGVYDLKAERAGLKTRVAEGIRVDLDRSAALVLRMEIASLRESLDVAAASPEIDVTTATTGLSATADLYDRVPLERSFFAIARIAPGTQEDGTGAAFSGSTGLENQYVIDGLNVTGALAGGHGKELNFDFVDEVEVKAGGLPAEYGRTTGGILNVLTKSGGNDFHGSAFGFFTGRGLQSDNRTESARPADTTTVDDTTSKWDFGAELGGRLVRDRLWFFAAFNRVAKDAEATVVRGLSGQGAPSVGSKIPSEQRDNRFAGKLTWRPAASSSIALSVFGDPNRSAGPVKTVAGPASTYFGTTDGGGTDTALRYQGTFGSSLLVQALYGRHRESFTRGGLGTEVARFDDLTLTPQASSGGLGVYGDQSFERDVYKLDLSKAFKGHDLKLGGDVEAVLGTERFFVSGGDWVMRLRTPSQVDYYSHFLFIDDRAPGFSSANPSTWQPVNPFASAVRTRNVSAYGQDAWRIGKGLTLNLGLRFERQTLKDRDGATPLAIDNWAPRIGAAWDVRRQGRNKLYASFGRYFESIPQLIQFRAFGGETPVFSYNFNPTPGVFLPNPAAPQAPFVAGGQSTDVASRIGGQYVDEYVLGFERQVRKDFVVGLRAGRRRLGRVIEDLTAGNGDYFFGNPGEGSASALGFVDGGGAPSPRAKRTNDSVEATARKGFSGGWQLLASYVFTRLDGNYEGSYQRSTGSAAPNWTSAFDYADFLVNASGPLTSESRHQVKLDGSYELRGRAAGMNLGLSTHWYSGWPENAYGFSSSYRQWTYFLAPRGSLGRNPADFEIDVHASYPIHVGKIARLRLQADVFNLLDRQAPLSYDQRYNLLRDGPCAGVPRALCTSDGGLATRPGTLEPLGTIVDLRRTATNPDFLDKANLFTGQRNLRIGLRLMF